MTGQLQETVSRRMKRKWAWMIYREEIKSTDSGSNTFLRSTNMVRFSTKSRKNFLKWQIEPFWVTFSNPQHYICPWERPGACQKTPSLNSSIDLDLSWVSVPYQWNGEKFHPYALQLKLWKWHFCGALWRPLNKRMNQTQINITA